MKFEDLEAARAKREGRNAATKLKSEGTDCQRLQDTDKAITGKGKCVMKRKITAVELQTPEAEVSITLRPWRAPVARMW